MQLLFIITLSTKNYTIFMKKILDASKFIFIIICISLQIKCQSSKTTNTTNATINNMKSKPMIEKSEAEWKQLLTDEEYHVLREAGTERAFTGKYTDTDDDGNYYCKACGNLIFTSTTKYHSGCGWPAFYDKAGETAVETRMDYSFGMTRIEVLCKKCHSHLGHVFEDGPKDKTGLRYCINSISMEFQKDSSSSKEK